MKKTHNRNIIDKVTDYIFNPRYRFDFNLRQGFYDSMDDEKFIRKQYKVRTGRTLDLKNPQRFNEKLQWLKLYNRKDLFTTMVDKYEVKKYVTSLIGERYVIPLLGVWDHFDEIDFDKMPEQFVLKTTHGSGGIAVCRDKSQFDPSSLRDRFENALKVNYFIKGREWPYKNVKPRIIAEQYVQDGDTLNLNVYKVFNLSGKPTLIQTIQNDKNPNETIDYFDTSWNLLELRQNFPNSPQPLPKPKTLDEILDLSAKCSKGFPFLRTDWFEVNNQVFFSEFTFYSDNGFEPFYPDSWDLKLGSLIDLSLVEK